VSDARWYAVWPNPRSRSRALESWKSSPFSKARSLPFTMGAGNWPRILKLGHNIYIRSGRIFDICPSFCVAWLCKESTVSPIRGYFFGYFQFDINSLTDCFERLVSKMTVLCWLEHWTLLTYTKPNCVVSVNSSICVRRFVLLWSLRSALSWTTPVNAASMPITSTTALLPSYWLSSLMAVLLLERSDCLYRSCNMSSFSYNF